MNFTIPKATLAPALATVARAVANKPPLPILSNVVLTAEDGRVTLGSSDLTTWVQVSCLASVEEPGCTTVNHGIFDALIRSLPDDPIEISIIEASPITGEPPTVTADANDEDGELPPNGQDEITARLLQVCSRQNVTLLATAEADAFPEFPEHPAGPSFDIAGATLATAVSQVADAANPTVDRPILTGVNVSAAAGESSMAATAADSFRLARQHVDLVTPPEADVSFTVPADVINIVARPAQRADSVVHVAVSPEAPALVHFESADVSIFTRPIAGQYPDVDKVIPTEFLTRVYVAKGELSSAANCATAVLATQGADVPIRMMLSPEQGTMRIWGYTNENDEFDTELSVTIDPPAECRIAFRPKFLQHVLKTIPSHQEVELALNDQNSPAVIRGRGDDRYTYVVMPTFANW